MHMPMHYDHPIRKTRRPSSS